MNICVLSCKLFVEFLVPDLVIFFLFQLPDDRCLPLALIGTF